MINSLMNSEGWCQWDDDVDNDDADHDLWNIWVKIEQIWGEILVKNAKGLSASSNQCNDSNVGAGSDEE